MLNAEVISPENAFPCFPVIILDDDDLEYDEILVIVLTSGDFSVAVIPEGVSLTVQDNDGTLFGVATDSSKKI